MFRHKKVAQQKRTKILLGVLAGVIVVGSVVLYQNGSLFQGKFNFAAHDLSVGVANVPPTSTAVRLAIDVPVVGFNFAAGPSDVTVTDLTLTGYLGESGDLGDVAISVSLLDETGAQLGSTESVAADGTVTFNALGWTIPAGQQEKVVVVADIGGSGIPLNGDPDLVSFYIADIAGDVVAEDTALGNSMTPVEAPAGLNADYAHYVEVQESGSITVKTSNNPVASTTASAGADSVANPLLVARYTINSALEDFEVDDMTFENDPTNALVNDSAIDQVILKYPTSLSSPTLDGSKSVVLVGGKASFTNLGLMVPQRKNVKVEVYVVTNDIGSGANVGDQIELDFSYDDSFRATGQSSAEAVTESDTGSIFGTTADVDANEITLN